MSDKPENFGKVIIKRLTVLPLDLQTMILDDLRDTIDNRLRTIERIVLDSESD